MNLSMDIPDPTDWLKTSVPAIQALESALRCQVCKEYFTAPMVTSCGHTFCSLCIRRCLTSTQKCPTCMATDEESKLRKNTAVQEISVAFQAVRDQMLEKLIAKAEEEAKEAEEAERTRTKKVEKRGSYEIDDIENDEEVSERRRGKRRRQEQASQEYSNEREPTRRSARTSSQRTTSKMSSQAIVIDDSGDDDDDFNPAEESEHDFGTPKSKKKQPAKVPATPPDNLPSCPICGRRKTPRSINEHVNRCIEGNRSPTPVAHSNGHAPSPVKPALIAFPKAKAPSSIHRPPYTDEEKAKLRIPKGNYQFYKEVDIKKKLTKFGIKVDIKKSKDSRPNKDILWDRWVNWINIWNANLDSDNPKLDKELVKDLEAQEKWQQNQKPSVVQSKEFGREDWGKNHGDDYEKLIADARKRAAKKKEEKETSGEGSSKDAAPTTPQSSSANLMTTEVTGVGSPEVVMES